MLIHDFLEYYARDNPDVACVTQAEISWTYAEQDNYANQLANGLLDLGVAKGDRVAIIGENSPAHYSLFFATSKIGAVAVPLNYRLAPAELAFIINDADVKVLLVLDGMERSYDALKESLNGEPKVLYHGMAGQEDWDEWINQYPTSKPLVDVAGGDPLVQMYTSGTTGNPKGVVTSHANIMSLVIGNDRAAPYRAAVGDSGILVAPLFHIGGAGSVFAAIFGGQQSLLHKAFDPVKLVEDMEQYPVTGIFMVPAMIGAVLQLPDIEQRDFSKLRQIFYGASPISETVLRRALEVFQCDFVQMYGMTETAGTVVSLSAEDHCRALSGETKLLRSAGRPVVGAQVQIMSPSAEQMPVGEVGEIWLKSENNMLGYFHLPEATQDTMIDGWVRTGDAGYIDEEGFIYLKDRIKDMVVSGAENIYPVEVENAIAKHAAVVDVAVIGIPDEKFGEALLAFVVLKSGESLSSEELVEFCRDKIAGYKIPRQLKVIDELPRNASGKVLKKVLREPFWSGMDRGVA
jgi:acyl-CoA synthetase (AMP-forming)/AMP-acid ligase II